MSSLITHDKLINRYEFSGLLVMDTALHVGSGKESVESDASVIRDHQGHPYIPGSSLKGVLRSRVEALAHCFQAKGVTACRLLENEPSCLTTDRIGENSKQAQYEAKQQAAQRERSAEQQRLSFLEENLCSVCKLFGSPYLGAKIRVDDLPLAGPWLNQQEIRDGVGIDRDSGIAAPQVKFTYEVVPSLTAFQFSLRGENLTNVDKALLAVGLLELIDGYISIGGLSSRGLGKCHLELQAMYQVDFTDDEALLAYLTRSSEVRKRGNVADPRQILLEWVRRFIEGGE